jgi:membrane-associated phospholipid phosphatase
LETLDRSLLLALNGLAGRSLWLDRLATALVNDYLVPALLAVALFAGWFSGRSRQEREAHQRAVLATLTGVFLANLVTVALNSLVPRPRPFQVEAVTLLFYRPTDPSFPSNPAVVGFALALGVWFVSRRLGAVAFVLAALGALSRVYVGVAYPSDVVAGALLGLVGTGLGPAVLRWTEPLPTRLIQWCRRWYLA